MKPIYFPYTYIADPVAEAVAACFGQFTVYQPLADRLPLSMQPWVDKNIIDIRIPVRGDDQELTSAAENYLNWANLHAGSARATHASLKTLTAAAPHLDASLSSQIATDVKAQISASSAAKSADPVLSSRIFLYFAQQFDQQSQEIDHVLVESIKKEQDLIRDLKVEEDALAAELQKEHAPRPDMSTDYLISVRLEAWTRILLEDRQPAGFFVTHSTATLEQLLDRVPAAEKVLDLEAIPPSTATTAGVAPWQEKLMSYLSDIAENKWPAASDDPAEGVDIPAAENPVSLKIYLVPDQNPIQFFCCGAGIKGPGADLRRPTAEGRNTLLALVQPQCCVPHIH
jgi:hypothetical protein